MKIGFVGLSHLGIVNTVVAASKDNNIIAYGDQFELKKINAQRINIKEPNLNNLYFKHKKKIIFTNCIKDLEKSDIIYISKDVSTDKDGNSDLSDINKIIKKISLFKRKKILVILSQVPPGFTRKIYWPSSKLYYQVETLIFGMAMSRALKPERIIIGCSDSQIEINKKLKNYLTSFKCPILKMKYESAELAKISINMYLISSITTTNLLCQICEKTSAKWSEILPSLRLDKRIGKYAYLKPGLGISGGNLERDLNTITKICKKNKVDSNLFKLWKKKSNYYRLWVLRKFEEVTRGNKISKIAMLGLAYKANTDSTKNSPSIMLINKLKGKYKIKAYDPLVKKTSYRNLNFVNSIFEALKDSDILFIMTPCEEFKNLSVNKIKKFMKGNIIIDPYGILNKERLLKFKFNYYSISN